MGFWSKLFSAITVAIAGYEVGTKKSESQLMQFIPSLQHNDNSNPNYNILVPSVVLLIVGAFIIIKIIVNEITKCKMNNAHTPQPYQVMYTQPSTHHPQQQATSTPINIPRGQFNRYRGKKI